MKNLIKQIIFKSMKCSEWTAVRRIWGSHSGGYQQYFWDTTPGSPLNVSRRFEGTCRHLQDRISRARNQSESRTLLSRWWRCSSETSVDVTSQKMVLSEQQFVFKMVLHATVWTVMLRLHSPVWILTWNSQLIFSYCFLFTTCLQIKNYPLNTSVWAFSYPRTHPQERKKDKKERKKEVSVTCRNQMIS
jgi:hypothetical protein